MPQNSFRWLLVTVLLVFISGNILPALGYSASLMEGSTQAVLSWKAKGQPEESSQMGTVHPSPSIQLDTNEGYAGQTVTASGASPDGFEQVRLAWWVGEATRTEVITPLQPDLSYESQLTVPEDALPGPAQICAAVAGPGADSELAEFACEPFTILSSPPADLTGAVPLPASKSPSAFSANLLLTDQSGDLAALAPIASDGTFSFSRVPPGNYTAVVDGELPIPVEPQDISLAPGSTHAINLTPATWLACAVMPAAVVSDILVTPGVKGISSPGAPKTVGTYLSLSALGPLVNIHLQAVLQVAEGNSVQRVEFWLVRPDGFEFKVAQDSTAPYEFDYNASLLMVGNTKITAKAIMTDGACTRSLDIFLHAIGHPFNSPYLVNDITTWNAALVRYEFSADIPYLPGSLPARYPDPPPSIPLVGTVENSFNVWQHYEGYLYLNRGISLHLMQYHADAKVFSKSILNKTETWWNTEHAIGTVDGNKPPNMHFGPSTMMSYNKTYPVYSGPLWTFAGIVTVNASIKVGFYGDINLQGTLEPWTPAASMYLTPHVSPYLTMSIWLDLLLIIGKVGVTATTNLGFHLPLAISTKSAAPVHFENPCVSLLITLTGWAEIYYFFDTEHWNLFDFEVVDQSWGSCNLANLAANAPELAPEMRSLPAPEIASSPSGKMVMVYVEDTTPDAPSSTPQVMARFWDPESGNWGPATAVSEAGFFVKDPAITFVGPDDAALAVWSQNTLTREQGAALGQDVSAIFSFQEIYYSLWTGSGWSTPQRLTEDNIADGVATIAGDIAGGATLAWVADTDGNLATHDDLVIVTQEWDGSWGARQTMDLNGIADAALDAQVRVIRPASRTLTSLLVWTSDLDADLTTNADRTLIVSRLVNGEWITEALHDLVIGADSPTAAWDAAAQTLHIAYLVRGKDEDSLTDTGLGNLGQLWAGQWDSANGWSGFYPVLEAGQPVFAEGPKLLATPNHDISLLFRRFGDPGTPGQAGALALSQYAAVDGGFSAPLYLKPQAGMNWMQTAAVFNPNQIAVVSMNSALSLPPAGRPWLASASPSVTGLHNRQLALAGTAGLLETSLIDHAPDPSLDGNLEIWPVHAATDTPLEIWAVLRNLGRQAATDMVVNLYAGMPGNGVLLQSQVIPELLAFNESLLVNFDELSTGAPQPFYIELVPGGPDLNPDNNLASGDAGAFPAPGLPNVQPGAQEQSLLVSWLPPEVAGVVGYRILRAENSDGPYELVGLSLGTFFEDFEVKRGKEYFYIIQGYDANGNWSTSSEQVSGWLPLLEIYLSLILRGG